MKPIQLWLPQISGGVHSDFRQRDITRAHQLWDRDQVVWLVPGWTGPETWGRNGLRERCIPSEDFETCLILHIGESGRAVGPKAATFPDERIDSLLTAWLRDDEPPFRLRLGAPGSKKHIRVQLPEPHEVGIRIVEDEFECSIGTMLPIEALDLQRRQIRFAVGNHPGAARPVSIELEADPGAKCALEIQSIDWAAPFASLVPALPSIDDIFARDEMREVARLSETDQRGALMEAIVRSKPWISDGMSTQNLSWLQPIIREEGETGAVIALEARTGIELNSLRQAYQDVQVRSFLDSPVRVSRAWGVPGLMWSLLLDALETGRSFRSCKRCGQMLPPSGRSDREYCSKEENPGCRKAYERERKSKTRSRQHTA